MSDGKYEDFKSMIQKALIAEPSGLTWSQIKERLGLPQKVPNNRWVRMMEKDLRLQRTTDEKTRKMIWRLKGH